MVSRMVTINVPINIPLNFEESSIEGKELEAVVAQTIEVILSKVEQGIAEALCGEPSVWVGRARGGE